VVSGFLRGAGAAGSGPEAEDAALVIVVMQLRAIRLSASTGQKKTLTSRQHAQGWRAEIDPKGVPVAGTECGAEGPGRVRAHAG
jgi:hypothetical protein